MQTRDSRPEARWEALVGFFIANKLVVFTLLGMLIVAGLAYAPFRWQLGDLPRDPVAVDALPDISENQQIVFTEWPGRSPRDVEDQVSYPLTTALLGIPGVRSVRSTSVFGFSSIYAIFEDDVDFYWSRSRVLEKLASLPAGTVPDGVTPTLGPDATALGQVYAYTLEARDAHGDVVPAAFGLAQLRSIQDWTVRYALQSVTGVSEVASVGGFVREYQVDVDPEAMLAHRVTLAEVAKAVKEANLDIGARTIEINQVEYIIRGRGFIETLDDLEGVVVAAREHTPIRIADVASVSMGPALRRGVLDKAGAEAVGGIVTVRFGANPLATIDRLREKIAEISPGLPRRTMEDGTVAQVQIVPYYDRTELIHETLDTLSLALIQQVLITVIVVLLFMRHLRSSLLVSLLLPLGVLSTFVLMKTVGVDANVMALAGIAIAIGTMVDMGIVFVENMVHHVERTPPGTDPAAAIRTGAGEVAAAVLTSLLTTILGFIPVFGLTGAEGKLFGPLAYTKTFALASAFIVALVVLPALAHLVLRRASSEGGARRAFVSLLRREALFDWAIVVVGGAVLTSGLTGAGLTTMAVGMIRLAEPALPTRWRPLSPWLANTITVVAVTVGLTAYWLPLGPQFSLQGNLAFVVVLVAGLMAGFWLFAVGYRGVLAWCLRHRVAFLSANVAFVVGGFVAWRGADEMLGWLPDGLKTTQTYAALQRRFPGIQDDFMPPFDEGSFLYMPTTTPHASIGQAKQMLQHVDAAIAALPEVSGVVGKLGRADTPLDPAPISMFETVINYASEYKMDARGHVGRYAVDDDGEFVVDDDGELRPDPDGQPFRQWRPHIHSPQDIWSEITAAAEYPGLTGAPKLMPIKTRIVMLQTGMRSAVGMKIRGPDLETIEAFGLQMEALLQSVPDKIARSTVFADRIVGKPYLEIDIDREAISRFGLSIVDVQTVLQIAVGGKMLTRTVEGRERYPVRVRYMREDRDSVEAIGRVLVPGRAGEQIPLRQLTSIRYVRGPQMIRGEDTFLNAYVTFDPAEGVGEVEAVEVAQKLIDDRIARGELVVPAGVSYRFTGTYENQLRSQARLLVLVPLALAVIFMLLYLQFRSTSTALMVFSGMLLAAAGGFYLLWLYGQPWFLDASPFDIDLRELFQVRDTRITVAVWVGFLALFGVATDNGVIVATYLTQTFREFRPRDVAQLRARVIEAGHRRVRPCLMTTATTLLALLPVVTSPGRGADLMVPMALPTVGGIGMSLLTLLTVPVLFSLPAELKLWRRRGREATESTDA
jgi:Cu(I)/Ag(I) efflux system membrane protein CusA/SilA